VTRALAPLAAVLFLVSVVHADRPWSEIRGRNVSVFGPQSPRTLRDTAIQLEQFRQVVGRLIRGARQTQSIPTEVYLFDDSRALQPYVPLYQGRPAALTGYCHCGASDEISVILASRSDYAESSSIVFHEYTHLLMRNAVRDVPVWMNEGIAEYFSTFALQGNGRQARIGMPIERHVLALRDDFIPLSQLLTVGRTSPLYNERSRKTVFYAEAWALTHYLVAERPGGLDTMNALLTEYANGGEPAAALVKATGLTLKAIEDQLRGMIAQPVNLALGEFRPTQVTLSEAVAVDQPSEARTLASADTEARLGEIQLRVDRVGEAVPRIEAAAAGAPSVAQAQLVLARLRLRQSRNGEAVALLGKATRLAPDDFAGQYLYGLTLLRGEGELDSAWPSDRARVAREALTRAVALRPDSAAALAWLGYADQQLGQHLDEARAVTRKAIELAPGRIDYVIQLAEIDLDAGELDEAKRLLAPILTASDAATARQASQLLAAVERRTQPPPLPTFELSRQPQDLRGITFRLRELQPGERRDFAELFEIACGSAGVRFRLRVDGEELAATASRFEAVEMTAFGDASGQTVRCGPHVPADKVYVTRRTDGSVVALEFMPRDYTPQR
jgi:tetratricopeptide (TPR) repeat protein